MLTYPDKELIKMIFWGILLIGAMTLLSSPAHPQALVIDHTCRDLTEIPDAWITQAKSDLHIVYQHTSHGSQLVTGLSALEAYTPFGSKYDWEDDGAPASALDFDDYGIPGCADLSQGDWIDGNGVTPWVTSTRALLDNPSNAHVNVVMWSWCSIDGHNITRYLDNMEILVSEYPGVTFVFMTGHAEGQGEGAFIHTANEQIRQHCDDYGRVLFDFADIENYDPDGSYYYDLPMWDDLDYNPGHANNWGQEWCLANDGTELEQLTTGDGVSGYSGCGSCAHSDGPGNLARINCVLKGRAAWWMFARIAGWGGGSGPTPSPTPPPTTTPWPTGVPTWTPTTTPTGRAKLAVMKGGRWLDENLYFYNVIAPGDWSYWDAAARNPSAFARDLWVIPPLNGVVCMTASAAPVRAGLFVLKAEGESACDLFLYNCPAEGDWTYWDAFSRNPSPLARDLWVMGASSAPVGIASVDDINDDGVSDLALLRVEGAGDMNIYYYNAPVQGDLTYWDCIARNPSPLARDFWVIPSGNGAVGMAAVNTGGGGRDLAILKREGAGDLNIYLYRTLACGDWTYWDALSRNPSARARDLWKIPSSNDVIGMAAIDGEGDGPDELLLVKREGSVDSNLYLCTVPLPGDWAYWDAVSRNPSPLARDLWVVPAGNDAEAITATGAY